MSKELQDQVEKAVARAKNVKATRSDPNCACPSCLDASVILAMAAEVERLREELRAAARWIGSTQYRVSDDAHKQFAAHLIKTLESL